MRLPYVLDNRSAETSMRRVLGDLLALPAGKAVDVVSAFFSIREFGLLPRGWRSWAASVFCWAPSRGAAWTLACTLTLAPDALSFRT